MMRLRSATPAEQLQEIRRGLLEVLPEEELLIRLESSYQNQIPLVVKFGADPSSSDLHLGHTVIIQKLKILQEFGHEIVFLIGDFTSQIGDPTGKNQMRKQLTVAEVTSNMKTYQEQVFKILDPQWTRVVYNSHWWNELGLQKFFEILSMMTVSQLSAREDFAQRLESNQPIYLHEFLYPILQGYDSVVLKADLEFGGSDQKFNLLVGRTLQKYYQQRPQVILTMPLLEGLDGVQKMSKSLNNVISLVDSAETMFGKLMSISDPLMYRYYELLSCVSVQQIEHFKKECHPMEVKKNLAQEIVDRFHGVESGRLERKKFEARFSKKQVGEVTCMELSWQQEVSVVALMVQCHFAQSNSEARRLLKQRAVRLNGQTLEVEQISLKAHQEYLLQVGKLNQIKLLMKSH